MKENYIAYFDETGDDGNNTNSSDIFLLTSILMKTLKVNGKINLNANKDSAYGIVKYPK